MKMVPATEVSAALEVSPAMTHIHQRMGGPNSLERVKKGKNVNHNETLYGIIQSCCKKIIFCWKTISEEVVHVESLNSGAIHTSDAMNLLAVEVNNVTTAYLEAKDTDKISRLPKSEKQSQKRVHMKNGDFANLKQAWKMMHEG